MKRERDDDSGHAEEDDGANSNDKRTRRNNNTTSPTGPFNNMGASPFIPPPNNMIMSPPGGFKPPGPYSMFMNGFMFPPPPPPNMPSRNKPSGDNREKSDEADQDSSNKEESSSPNAGNNNNNSGQQQHPMHPIPMMAGGFPPQPPFNPGFMGPFFMAPPPHHPLRFRPHRAGIVLSMACDAEQLSDYQILVRQQLELFVAAPEDVESNTQGRKKPVVLGQVGLRCRHCAPFPLRSRGRGAVYYPGTLFGIYQVWMFVAGCCLLCRCRACVVLLSFGACVAGGTCWLMAVVFVRLGRTKHGRQSLVPVVSAYSGAFEARAAQTTRTAGQC